MAEIHIFLSSNRKHLIFATKQFDEIGIEVRGKDKIGVLSIENPDNALEALEKAKSLSWIIGDEKDEFGFFSVKRQ